MSLPDMSVKVTDKIMIVEDDAELRKKLMEYFVDNGFEITEASDGKEALLLFEKEKPDVILTDIDMPKMNGIALLETILKQVPNMPVVVAVLPEAMQEVIQAIRLGASDFVAKPYNSFPVVEHVVCKALERARLIEENKRYREALEKSNQALNKNLNILKEDQEAGRSVQMRMLPEQNVQFGAYRFSHGVTPSLYLSGDFLDYFRINDETIGFYIADVSGHGASSAFVTVLLKSLVALSLTHYQLRKSTRILEPDKLLATLGKEIHQANLGKYLTIVYGVLNLKTNILEYSIGGHYPNPLLIENKSAKFLEGRGFPVGIMGTANYQKHQIEIPNHAHLVMFSDGVLEIIAEKDLNKKEQYILDLASKEQVSVNTFKEHLKLNDAQNLPDDITMLILSREDKKT